VTPARLQYNCRLTGKSDHDAIFISRLVAEPSEFIVKPVGTETEYCVLKAGVYESVTLFDVSAADADIGIPKASSAPDKSNRMKPAIKHRAMYAVKNALMQ
jgi:hypothetical protein